MATCVQVIQNFYFIQKLIGGDNKIEMLDDASMIIINIMNNNFWKVRNTVCMIIGNIGKKCEVLIK